MFYYALIVLLQNLSPVCRGRESRLICACVYELFYVYLFECTYERVFVFGMEPKWSYHNCHHANRCFWIIGLINAISRHYLEPCRNCQPYTCICLILLHLAMPTYRSEVYTFNFIE